MASGSNTKQANQKNTSLDFADLLLTEIALEGLEGITLDTLWIRLKEAYLFRGQTVNVDENSFQNAAWKSVLQNTDIRVFILPEEGRRSVIPENEYKRIEDYALRDVSASGKKRKRADADMDGEDGEEQSDTEADDAEPDSRGQFTKGWEKDRETAPTPLNAYGVYFKKSQNARGSCRFLAERKDVTDELRKEKTKKLATVKTRYGDCLVLVAAEEVRLRILGIDKLSPAHTKKMRFESMYALLEIIARHRHYGTFLVYEGWTAFGRGSRNVKQVHNYVKVLTEMDLITKGKARFGKAEGARDCFMLLSYAFFKPLSRPFTTPVETFLSTVETTIRDTPYPGYPSVLLPRLSGLHALNDCDFRRRLRGYFPNLQSVSVPLASLATLYPQLPETTAKTIHCLRFSEKVREPKLTLVKVEEYVVPDDLSLDPTCMGKAAFLAVLRLLKANRERGLSESDVIEILGKVGATRRPVATALRRAVSTGYAKLSGKFPTRNYPKRYILVSSEEERKSLSAAKEDWPPGSEKHPDPSPKRPMPRNQPPSDELLQVTSIAASWKVFIDTMSINEFGKFFYPNFTTIPPGRMTELIFAAVDSEDLEFRLVPTNKNVLRGVDPNERNRVELTTLIVSCLTATQQDVSDYIAALTFRNTLLSFFGNSYLNRQPRAPELIPCADVFVNARLWRLRVLHRYLFCLAHFSSDAPAAVGSWKEHIVHTQFAENYPGWVTMDQIIQRMPLAVLARMVPLSPAADDPDATVKKCLENAPASLWPLAKQNSRVLRHVFYDRLNFTIIRDFLFGLRCMGLVSLGPSDANLSFGLYPERTELFYIHPAIILKDTAQVPVEDIARGLMTPEVSAATPDKLFHFQSDEDVVSFWQYIGNLAVPCQPRSRVNRAKLVRNHEEIRRRLPEAYQIRYPPDVTEPSRPPGDQLAVAGFDSCLTLHVSNVWKKMEVAALRLIHTKGYLRELDEFKIDWNAVQSRRVAPAAKKTPRVKKGKSPEVIKPETVIVVQTGGKRLKPGPKPNPILRGSNTEIHQLFSTRRKSMRLFSQVRPWQCGEEMLLAAFIGARDLIHAVRKRPSKTGVLSDLLEDFFPDRNFQRSLGELEVAQATRQRNPDFMSRSHLAGQIMQQQSEYKIVRLRFKNVVLNDQVSMKALYSSWRKLVQMCMDAVFRARPHLRRKSLMTPTVASNVTKTEVAQQFALESLILSLCLTNQIWTNDMETVRNRYSDRVIVGMGTYLRSRGVMSSRKLYERLHDPSIMTIGRVAIGLSARFVQLMDTVHDRAVGSILRADSVEALASAEMNPEMLPHWLRTIRTAQVAVGCTLKDIDRNIRLIERSSFRIEPEPRSARDDKKTKPLRLHGFRFRNALPGVIATATKLQDSMTEKFAILKAQLEDLLTAREDQDGTDHIFVNLGFELPVQIYTNIIPVYEAIQNAGSEGLTKANLWNLMGEDVSLPTCQAALDVLLKRQLVIPAGIEQILYVSMLHADPWLYRVNDGQMITTAAFQPRPWLTVDGQISPTIFLKYVQWISWYICEKRILPLANLLREFQPYMLGRHTLELISILRELGLIKKLRATDDETTLFQELTAENEWMDDGDWKCTYIRCSGDTWEYSMGISLLEEELGLRTRTNFATTTAEEEDAPEDEETDGTIPEEEEAEGTIPDDESARFEQDSEVDAEELDGEDGMEVQDDEEASEEEEAPVETESDGDEEEEGAGQGGGFW